jgi:hypothetical protein
MYCLPRRLETNREATATRRAETVCKPKPAAERRPPNQPPSPAITPLNPTIIRSGLRGRGAGLGRWPQSITATMVHDV